MITEFRIFEKVNNYNVDDIIIVTNKDLGLNNRMVVIDTIIQDKREGTKFKVWNATKNENDKEFTIYEKDIVKKMPTYKNGDFILLKDYYTGKYKPMIILNHIECGLFEMINLGYTDEIDDEEGDNFEYVNEPYYNIIRKMTKKDLEKYKDIIDQYYIKKDLKKFNM